MNLAIFDIDGTLTRTVDVDASCFARAFADAHGLKEINTDWSTYQHSTDSGIAAEILDRHLGRPPAPDDVERVRVQFVELLRQAHAQDPRQFEQVRGAAESLRSLAAEGTWASAIATGGWQMSARFKLACAGIDTQGLAAAFADDHHARWEIVRTAVARAEQAHAGRPFDRIVYIGDARWDLHTATKLHIGFVGIGAGDRAELLRRGGATRVLPDFTSRPDLLEALDHAARASGQND